MSDAELLAILLRTGDRSRSVLDLAGALLSECGGNLIRLSNMELDEICRIKGIKKDKAATVMAAFELGRRFLTEVADTLKISVSTAADVYRAVIPSLKGLTHEECWVLYLNRARYILGRERMSTGGSWSTTIDVRDIIRSALKRKAGCIILVHNHPSGNPEPSGDDIQATGDLKRAASMMGILLLDHVVVCDDCYYSFNDEIVEYAPTAPYAAWP